MKKAISELIKELRLIRKELHYIRRIMEFKTVVTTGFLEDNQISDKPIGRKTSVKLVNGVLKRIPNDSDQVMRARKILESIDSLKSTQ